MILVMRFEFHATNDIYSYIRKVNKDPKGQA